MVYTIVLGICMLLCLLMIGRMLLGRPAQDRAPEEPIPQQQAEQEEGYGISIDEQTLRDLLAQTLALPSDSLTVHISADETISAAMQVERKTLQESGLVPGSLRTALLFLPEQCKIYGAWHAEARDGAIVLTGLEMKLGDLALPADVIDTITAHVTEAVQGYLSEQACCPKALHWSDGSIEIEE